MASSRAVARGGAAMPRRAAASAAGGGRHRDATAVAAAGAAADAAGSRRARARIMVVRVPNDGGAARVSVAPTRPTRPPSFKTVPGLQMDNVWWARGAGKRAWLIGGQSTGGRAAAAPRPRAKGLSKDASLISTCTEAQNGLRRGARGAWAGDARARPHRAPPRRPTTATRSLVKAATSANIKRTTAGPASAEKRSRTGVGSGSAAASDGPAPSALPEDGAGGRSPPSMAAAAAGAA